MNMLRGYLWSLPEDNLNLLRSNYAAAMSSLITFETSLGLQSFLATCGTNDTAFAKSLLST